MLLGHEKFTTFSGRFSVFKYTVIAFMLTNTPATSQQEINQILGQLLGIELVINTNIHIGKDDELVVVTYIDDIIIVSKRSVEKHRNKWAKCSIYFSKTRLTPKPTNADWHNPKHSSADPVLPEDP
jgi:hypothetical protein